MARFTLEELSDLYYELWSEHLALARAFQLALGVHSTQDPALLERLEKYVSEGTVGRRVAGMPVERLSAHLSLARTFKAELGPA